MALMEMSTTAKTAAIQHTGVYIGYVIDNELTNPSLNQGHIKFRIPYFGNDTGFPSAPYEARGVPPIGTECVIAFEGVASDKPRVVCFNQWQSAPIMFYQSQNPDATGQDLQPGDLWIEP